MSILTFGKNAVRRFTRCLLGDYTVYHVLCFDDTPEQHCHPQDKITTSATTGGIRFSAMRDGQAVCSCEFWTAEHSNNVRNFYPLKNGDMELVFLQTNPEYRNQGLGNQLVEYASAEMLRRGSTKLYARIWHSNKPSLRTFYKSRWKYAYTAIEIHPLGRHLKFNPILPHWLTVRIVFNHGMLG